MWYASSCGRLWRCGWRCDGPLWVIVVAVVSSVVFEVGCGWVVFPIEWSSSSGSMSTSPHQASNVLSTFMLQLLMLCLALPIVGSSAVYRRCVRVGRFRRREGSRRVQAPSVQEGFLVP